MRTVTSDCVAGKSWRVSLNIMLNIRTSFKIAMMATGTDMTAISMRLDLPWLRLLQIAMRLVRSAPGGGYVMFYIGYPVIHYIHISTHLYDTCTNDFITSAINAL